MVSKLQGLLMRCPPSNICIVMIITDINQIHKLAFDMLWDGISSKIYFDDYRLIERCQQDVIGIYVVASNAQKCLNRFRAELKDIIFDGATDVIFSYRGVACSSDYVLYKDSQTNSDGNLKIRHQRKLLNSDEYSADNEVIFMVIGYGTNVFTNFDRF